MWPFRTGVEKVEWRFYEAADEGCYVPEGQTDRSQARSAWESVLERTVP